MFKHMHHKNCSSKSQNVSEEGRVKIGAAFAIQTIILKRIIREIVPIFHNCYTTEWIHLPFIKTKQESDENSWNYYVT